MSPDIPSSPPRHSGETRAQLRRMARPELTKSDTLRTATDEDYESDDSDIERLTTRLLDPAEDGDSLVELETAGQTVLSFAEDSGTESCSVFLAETGDEGPLAGIFLSDGEQYGGEE